MENPEREADILTGWGIYINQQQPALKTCIWEVPAAQMLTPGSLNVVAKCGVSFAGGMACAFHKKLQVFMIELRGISMALTTALDMGLSDIWIVSDSMNAVDIAEGKAATPWRARNILIRLQGLKRRFSRMRISHCWREANRA